MPLDVWGFMHVTLIGSAYVYPTPTGVSGLLDPISDGDQELQLIS